LAVVRTILGAVAALVFCSGFAVAQQGAQGTRERGAERGHLARVVKVDGDNHKITLHMVAGRTATGERGATEDKTMDLSKDVKVSAGSSSMTLSDIKPGMMVRVVEQDGKVTELHVMPRRPRPPTGSEGGTDK
jgi:hypothetical protein